MTTYTYQAYRLWTYDLWGNEEDGWSVNDRYDRGPVVLQVVEGDLPSDDELTLAVGGIPSTFYWDGEDGDSSYLYAIGSRTGKPLCELVRLHDDEAAKAIAEHLLNPINFPLPYHMS